MFLFSKKKKESHPYKIGLALSGGGARGFAHVGALQALEEYGLKPDIIAGTSAGSIVGSFYSDGYSPHEIMKIFSDMDIHELVEVTLPRKGFLKYDKFIAFLQKHLRTKRIEDLTHPMLIAATDFDHGKSVIFDHGDLAVRIAASCSIPIVFSPIEIDGINYVDGGVLRNLPATPLRDLCDVVIGVNVTPLQREKYSHNIIAIAERAYNYLACGNVFPDLALCDILIEHQDVGDYNVFDLKAQQEIAALGYNSTKNVLESLSDEQRKLLKR